MRTLIIAMPDGFDLSLSRASSTIRWGYYNGAKRAGIGAQLVEYSLLDALGDAEDPVAWLTYDDYRFLPRPTVRALRDYSHVVNVNCWFDGMERLHRKYGAPSPEIPTELVRAILFSAPDFVWASAPDAYLAFYAGWEKAGLRLLSLPWACDTERYYPESVGRFRGVQMAFVGGYRPYKESQYARVLWPYKPMLKVWGYTKWADCYQGYLQNDEERQLYTEASLCPTISEPQFVVTGDTVERPFKIMGCRGLTILDAPCYRELFTPEEALIATSDEDYREAVERLLNDGAFAQSYREAGYNAVVERHTYKHRVEKILENLR